MTVLEALHQLDTLLDLTNSQWDTPSPVVTSIMVRLLKLTIDETNQPAVTAALLAILKLQVKAGILAIETLKKAKGVPDEKS